MKDKKPENHVLCVLLGGVILLLSPMNLAAGGNVMRTQGLINPGGSLKAGYLLINEMRVYIDKTTQMTDHRGVPIRLVELKPKRWVYIETEGEPGQKIVIAKKIYLLPHYVNPEEKRKFSFMK
jgi:hypothetical protein